MRKLIISTVVGLALVGGLLLFVGTSRAYRPDVVGRAAMPFPGSPHPGRAGPGRLGPGLPVPPVGRPDPLPRPGRMIKLDGTIDALPTGTLTGTWWIEIRSGELISVEVTDTTSIVPPGVEAQEGDSVHVLAQQEDSTLVAKQVVVLKAERRRVRPVHILGQIEHLPSPTGTITGTWVVNGISFTVDSETQLRPEDRTPELGMWANVLAFEGEDGSLRAAKIVLQLREEAESEVEFEGPIEALPETGFLGTWVVDGISVTVTISTQLRGVTPTVGLNAEVEGARQEDESVLAHRIKVEPEEVDTVEFEGTLVSSATIPGLWLFEVDGEQISVTVTSETCINESRGPLVIGAWVEVKALEKPGEPLEAIYIKVEDGEHELPDIEFTGVITALPPSAPINYTGLWGVVTDTVTIAVVVTGNTEIEGTPEVGASAEIEGTLQGNGHVKAEKIEILEPPADD